MTATQQRTARQQPVHSRESTAPQLDPAVPWQPVVRPDGRALPGGDRKGQERRRTPLAVVPSPQRKSSRGFVALCVAILVAALMTVLVVNISVSNRQYEMVGLKSEQLDLSQANERLRQQVEHLEAPQNLSAEAARLGMVMPGDLASIDLETGTVSGTATAAKGEDKPADKVATPPGPGEEGAGAEGRDGNSTETVPTAGEAEHPRPATGADGQAAENGQPAEDRQAATGQDLNGGTIPAPEFSASAD